MSMPVSPEEARNIPSRRHDADPVACERCAATVELLTVLPRRADHVAYRIFGCTACSFVQWIPD